MSTLILGLGGTGTEVIRRLRDRWKDGGVPRDVAMAIIDAQIAEPQGERIEGVGFTPNKQISYPTDFEQTRQWTLDWFPDQETPDSLVQFTKGCGRKRANGKYFFFRFAKEIEITIRNACQKLVERRPGAQAPGFNSVRVVVVGSLGNATGGGTFMDAGALAKEILLQTHPEVECFGVFIPGSVTRHGQPGTILELWTAANGFASLLELQYEFNRRNEAEEGLKPREPYSSVAYLNLGARSFGPYRRGGPPSNQSSPLDYALLLDRYDRNGTESNYPTLLHIAAEGIAEMCEGIDADFRFLDGLLSVPGHWRFGSFGSVRLTVPSAKILQYTASAQALRTLDAAADIDPTRWASLLADESLDGTVLLRPEDATIQQSVSFFLEHVLHVKECHEKEAGQEINQLFDRFKTEDDGILQTFDTITEGVADESDEKIIAQRGDEILVFLEEYLENVARERGALLLEGDASLWSSQPRNPDNPIDAGTKWLLQRRVSRFVQAGAFGLLNAWLAELKRQVEENRQSVEEHEAKLYCSRRGTSIEEFRTAVGELRDEANSWLAGWKRQSLKMKLAQIHQSGRDNVELCLWNENVQAVRSFYDKVEAYVNDLRKAAETALELFAHTRMRTELENACNSMEKELTDSERQGKGGFKAEFYIGGNSAMRAGLLEDMERDPELSASALLRAMTGENEEIFLPGLPDDEKTFLDRAVHQGPGQDKITRIDNYREQLLKRIRRPAGPFVGRACQIDIVLENEARAVLGEFFSKAILDRDNADQSEADGIRRQLTDCIGEKTAQHIQQLDWSNRDSAMKKAILYFIAARLHSRMMHATAQWSVVPEAERDNEITPFAFISYPSQAAHVRDALAELVDLGLIANANQFKCQPIAFGDSRVINVLTIELGGHLGNINLGDEREDYRRAMDTLADFSPHTTRQYYHMGRSYLSDTLGAANPALPLLALAELYEYVSHDSVGNYRVNREIKMSQMDGRVLHGAYAEGFDIGRGIENVVTRLNSPRDDHRDLQLALKTVLWKAIETDAYGSDGSTPLRWDGVTARIATLAGEIGLKAQAQVNPRVGELLKRQSDALQKLAAELTALEGRSKPTALR